MEFYEKHPELRDKYEIVTFHGSGAKTYAELLPHLAQLEKDVWKRPFPFPILFDSSAKVQSDWGIFAYPTTVLINPEGKVVSITEGLERLKKELGVVD